VVDLHLAGLEAMAEISNITSTVHDVSARSEAVLDALERVEPFEAGMIRAYDPAARVVPLLATRGFSDRILRQFDNAYDEIEQLGLNRPRSPLRVRDMPVPPDELESWAEYLRPAGFRDGVAVCLLTPDDRHVGFLVLNTDSADRPSDAGLRVINLLAPVIATAIDPIRSVTAAARIVDDAIGGVIVTRSGTPQPLPGMSGHRLLAEGSPVLDVAADHVAAGGALTSFLVPDPPEVSRGSRRARQPEGERYLRATVLACEPTPLHRVAAAVVLAPSRELFGLTARELEILGLVVNGWSNQRIAETVTVTARTVAAHVEHILDKLGAATRTVAAVRAFRQGLYVPHRLASWSDE
jgi:DNA-binding CsgD family transcriptional regulator